MAWLKFRKKKTKWRYPSHIIILTVVTVHLSPATAAQIILKGDQHFIVLNFLITVNEAALQGRYTLLKCSLCLQKCLD